MQLLTNLFLIGISVLHWVGESYGLAIDNGVVGIPQVSCSETSVTFSVRSQNVFRGNIYIKNKYVTPECRQEYFSNTFNGASFTVTIGRCGMRRIRQLQPNGMNYILVFLVNFHPQFVTKIDRAYNVRCFYEQQDKTVTSQLEVSMLTTQTIEDTSSLSPTCEYSVRANSLNGPRVRFVRVGDMLFHRWECDNPNYGMLVKNCFVNDGIGSSVRVIDNRGCPVFSPVIQGSLQYDNSLNLAYVEIWAYKFPDRSSLFFQCQIQICNKRENGCLGITPPNCPRVLKSEFEPASTIDNSADPNRVNIRGNFDRFNPAPAAGTGFGVQQPVIPANTNNAAPNVAPAGYGGYNDNGAVLSQAGSRNQFPEPQKPVSYGGYNSPSVGGFNQNQQNQNQQQPQQQGYGSYEARFQNDNLRHTEKDLQSTKIRAQQDLRPQVQPTRQQALKEPRTTTTTTTTTPVPDVRKKVTIGGTARRYKDVPPQWDDNGWDSPVKSANPFGYVQPQNSGRFRRDSMEMKIILENQERAAAEADKNTMDIMSETVFVADVEDDPPDSKKDKEFTHFPFTSTEEEMTICLNPVATGLTLTCFSIMVVLLISLLVYVFSRHTTTNKGDRTPLTGTPVRRLWKHMTDTSSQLSLATCRSQSEDGDFDVTNPKTNISLPVPIAHT